jgi:hypothetical protein
MVYAMFLGPPACQRRGFIIYEETAIFHGGRAVGCCRWERVDGVVLCSRDIGPPMVPG